MENRFEQFKLQPYLIEALTDLQFDTPTPVQERVIPAIAKGESVIGQSQTGSGKTHAFLLPIMNGLNAQNQVVQAVITAPSRELARQTYDAVEQLASFSPNPISIGYYVGGTDKKRQQDKLAHQQPQIVIGTPGRILDLLNSQSLKIDNAHVFVVDEADMTLDMGFLKDVDNIASHLPKDLQMLVFSATIPQKLTPFLHKYMHNPVVEEIKAKTVISPTIDNWLLPTQGKHKDKLIYQLITIGHPFLVLIFANTKSDVDEIYTYLKAQNLKVAKIHGDVPPRERKRIMRDVHNLDYQFVVATDLAARGIDIEGVSHVINAGIPDDPDFFIHRVGRTGRNGMSGIAITLYAPGEEAKISELEHLGIKFTPKQLKNGEIIDGYDRNRRAKRTGKQEALNPGLKGLVKKEQRKHKPGYKKKIKEAIKRDTMQRKKIERRTEIRENRKRRAKNNK